MKDDVKKNECPAASFLEIMAVIGKRRKLGIRYHGNYCGPGWSGGLHQDSVRSTVLPVDDFDASCQDHDAAYADAGDLAQADMKFYRTNIGQGVKRSFAAMAVGMQGLVRSSFPENNSGMSGRYNLRRRNAPRYRPPTPPRPQARPVRMDRRARRRAVAARRQRRVAAARPVRRNQHVIRRRRVIRRPRYRNLMANGVQFAMEQGDVLIGERAVYLGHATCPVNVMKRQMCRALLKRLLIAMGKLNPNWDGAPKDVLANDRVILLYLNSPNGAPIQINVAVAALSQEAIASAWLNAISAESNLIQLVEMQYRPNDTPIGGRTINLSTSTIEFSIVSQLKMQNRTVSVAGDNEADDVNNVPLIGKQYYGKGTGTRYIVDAAAATLLYCGNFDGLITRSALALDSLREPPSGKLFDSVKKTTMVKLAPGVVNTSVLTTKIKMPLTKFLVHMLDTLQDFLPAPPRKHKLLGDFKLFGLEKEIQALAYAPENNLCVAYEHDLKVTTAVYPGKTQYTTSYTSQGVGVTP